MTDRLAPVGSCGVAEAWLVWQGMFVQIVHDDVVGDVTGSGREVTSRPEPLAPVAFADVLELLLDFPRRTSFGPVDEVADRDMRRYLDEQVDMVARQGAVDDGHAQLRANLPDDVPHSDPHLALQCLVAVLGSPDDMVTMMENRVTAGRISHSLYPRESETSRPPGGLTFPRIQAIARVEG